MSCRLACVVMLAGCTPSDDLVRQFNGTATMTVQLHSASDRDVDGATYTWTLITAPPGSVAEAPAGDATGAFTPDVRGAYLIDRWMHYGAAADLTDEFEVAVEGLAPSCNIAAVDPVAIGATAPLDGTLTTSAEHRPLDLHWRLAARPANSAAQLSDATSPVAHLTPDVAGLYDVELDAFDGELWCAAPIHTAVHAQ